MPNSNFLAAIAIISLLTTFPQIIQTQLNCYTESCTLFDECDNGCYCSSDYPCSSVCCYHGRCSDQERCIDGDNVVLEWWAIMLIIFGCIFVLGCYIACIKACITYNRGQRLVTHRVPRQPRGGQYKQLQPQYQYQYYQPPPTQNFGQQQQQQQQFAQYQQQPGFYQQYQPAMGIVQGSLPHPHPHPLPLPQQPGDQQKQVLVGNILLPKQNAVNQLGEQSEQNKNYEHKD